MIKRDETDKQSKNWRHKGLWTVRRCMKWNITGKETSAGEKPSGTNGGGNRDGRAGREEKKWKAEENVEECNRNHN